MTQPIGLSVIIPVTDRYDDVTELFRTYKGGIDAIGMTFEIVYVIDGHFPEVLDDLKNLQAAGERIKIITLAKGFGEATSLNVGFSNSSGDIILILPAYQQVKASEIPRLLSALKDHDMVVARRWPRVDSLFNRVQSKLFNWLLSFVSDVRMNDAGCNVRVFRRRVINEVNIYGDLHTFLPIIAHQHGFKVTELNVAQSEMDKSRRVYAFGIYPGKLLDILTVYFLVKFTKKPLRFFGLLGMSILIVGLAATLYIVLERLAGGIPLAGRPALLLSSLLIVLGIQVLAIGLIGEIVIFTHAKELKEYTIDEIIN